MSLTQNEANAAYNELVDIAISAGLNWLVEDVTVEISLGKQSLQKIETEPNQQLPKRKGKPAVFVTVTEYTEHEKLRLLIDALESVSFGMTIALMYVFDQISQLKRQPINNIVFAPDAEKEQQFAIDQSVFEKSDSVKRLQVLLKELKETI